MPQNQTCTPKVIFIKYYFRASNNNLSLWQYLDIHFIIVPNLESKKIY